MKIVHILESINPATGGPVKSVSSLAAAQALQGNDVTLMCYQEPDHNSYEKQLYEDMHVLSNLRIEVIPEGRFVERLFAKNARKKFDKLFSHIDVVHIHGVWKPFNVAACNAAIDASKKFVITPHGMLDPWSLSQKPRKKRMFMALLWRKLLNTAAFIHALNTDEARLLSPLGLTSPVKIFPNGIFPEKFKVLPSSSLFRQAHAQLGTQPYVLFLSRLHYKKGLDYLIDAFEVFCKGDEDTHLVIAGPDDGMEVQVRKWTKEKGLSKRVHLVGPLYGEQKFSALAGATCFCLPSRQEGFSMAICEALISRVPVVISEECHFPEVAQVQAGVVVPLNAQQLAQGLHYFCINSELREKAGQAGYELMINRFSWQNIAKELTHEYAHA